MSSGRDKNKIESPLTSSVIEIHLSAVAPPDNIPKKARPVSNLLFPNKPAEDALPKKTAHVVNTACKKNPKKPDELYYFKNNDAGAEISELEAACCSILQFLAPDNVPSARSYYDENQDYKFIGVTSKAIPGFKSNRDDPLQEKDIIIEVREKDIEQQRNCLQDAIKELMQVTDRSSQQTQNGSFLNIGLQYSKNIYNFYASSAPTAVKFREDLLTFMKMEGKYSQDSLFALKKLLQTRREHILKDIHNTSQYGNELQLLENAVLCADYLFKNTDSIMPETIDKLEELDRIVRAKKLDLNTLNENHVITAKIFANDFQIKVKSLKNYRIVKGQAIGECTRYIGKDPDGHNRNMNKYGQIIDFDMAKLNLLFRFRNRGLMDRMFREPGKKSFIVTERDIRFFPDIRDADFFYWPTKQSSVTQSVVDTIPKIFENFFTQHDNEVYKKLASNPIFIFHKFKTFLKYMLSNAQIHRSIAKLHMRTDVTFSNDEGHVKNLFDEFVRDEGARIQEITQTLVPMREFRDFLAIHGEYAFKLIKEEISQYRMKYEKKLAAKPYYKELVDSIDINEIEKKFREIFLAAGADKISASKAVLPLGASIQTKFRS